MGPQVVGPLELVQKLSQKLPSAGMNQALGFFCRTLVGVELVACCSGCVNGSALPSETRPAAIAPLLLLDLTGRRLHLHAPIEH